MKANAYSFEANSMWVGLRPRWVVWRCRLRHGVSLRSLCSALKHVNGYFHETREEEVAAPLPPCAAVALWLGCLLWVGLVYVGMYFSKL